MLPQVNGQFVLVRDPELRFSQAGKPWVKLRLVAKDRKRTGDGQWVDGDVCFIDALVGERDAEAVAESVGKGDSVLVSGKLQMREWETNEGQRMTSYSILVDAIGPSLRRGVVKSARVAAEQQQAGDAAVRAVEEFLGGEVLEEAPF